MGRITAACKVTTPSPDQNDLFGDAFEQGHGARSQHATQPVAPSAHPKRANNNRGGLQLAEAAQQHADLASRLSRAVHLGTSSWSYPGWVGQVWSEAFNERTLSRQGLVPYSAHPLMRTVSVDRALYQALSTGQYAGYAAQVPDDFRFMVKAPASVADALMRNEAGRNRGHNPYFLDPAMAEDSFIQPALQGLKHKIGALVFQLAPLPDLWLRQPSRLLAQLDRLLGALSPIKATAPDGVVALEVRDAALVTPELADLLKAHGATYCLGLHARMPPIEAQLPLLRRLWPGPLVCRWNLHRRHGTYGYEAARAMYAPFNRLQDEDQETRDVLAKVVRGTTQAGWPAYVSISNKAEGCAPLSVIKLAEAIVASSAA